jgi:predicted anti-sigma-YlaC factor YlaD
MDPIYDGEYDSLYDRLAAQVNFYPEARGERLADTERLKEIIDSKTKLHNANLRSDARYLLSVLFLQMVLMPVAMARRVGMEQVWESIGDDTDTLMETLANQSHRTQISGHMMLNTITSNWSRLRTTNFRIWGD